MKLKSKNTLINKRTGFLFLAFFFGVMFGVLTIQDIDLIVNDTLFLIFPIYTIIILCVVNIFFERKGFDAYLYPLLSFITYIPINMMSGIYYKFGAIRYYNSFPRYWILPYYLLFLTILYLAARFIVYLLKNKYSKGIYIVTDILSLTAYPVLAAITYFVSPH